MMTRFNELLSKYVTTNTSTHRRAFHNFTEEVKAGSQNSFRVIRESTTCRIPLPDNMEFVSPEDHDIFREKNVDDPNEFVVVKFFGDSFMMHQIRRMIGMVVSVMRGWCEESVMDFSLTASHNVNVPEAPGTGLFLNKMEFPLYNRKEMSEGLVIEWSKESDETCEKFKSDFILPEIVNAERVASKSASSWLTSTFMFKTKYFSVKENGVVVAVSKRHQKRMNADNVISEDLQTSEKQETENVEL
ncbi:hypothetical protein AKO1_006939 [Acrasis kona]|uniref:tRNA pseudouridine synthase n=1 Tax=Acrasis kona TaxID=1008807 RepID=A0AAW2YUG3_9EUKA